MKANNPFLRLQKKAKRFLKQPALKYYGISEDQLSHAAGVYMIFILDELLNETPLYINFTNNLQDEILTKKLAHKFINPSKEVAENCYLRYIEEPDVKEQMALTVAISLILKPFYYNN